MLQQETIHPFNGPMSFTLATPRCQFRSFNPTDISALTTAAGEHHGAISTAGLSHPESITSACTWQVAQCGSLPAPPIEWTILAIRNRRAIGYAGLHHINAGARQAQLRFWVAHDPDLTDCIQAIVDFAIIRLQLTRVYALQLLRQPRIGRILEAAGMTEEGLLRKRLHSAGLMEDIVCWAVTHDSWLSGVDARRPPRHYFESSGPATDIGPRVEFLR
jgi:RimJ/RimL family protein N-acetyltransferase